MGRHQPERRAAILEVAATQLESRADSLIAELVHEEGKTMAEATMEVSRTPPTCGSTRVRRRRATGSTYPRRARGPGLHQARAGRHRRGHHAVKLPVQHPVTQDRSCARGRKPCKVGSKPSEITLLMGQRLVEALLEDRLPPAAIASQGDGRRRRRRRGATVAAVMSTA